jgi:magnesium-transporting ATPase (P-type)
MIARRDHVDSVAPRAEGKVPWHAAEMEAVCASLATRRDGLTTQDVAQRLVQYGANTLPEPATRSPLHRFLVQFDNVLIYFLLVAAAAAWALGEVLDTWVVLGVVL